MRQLEFLSLDRADAVNGFEPAFRSPLERALRHAPPAVQDISHTGKIEVRGEVERLDEGEVVRIHPQRALVLCDYADAAEVRARLRARFEHVVDVTSALAGIRIRGERLLRRLTDLDLDALPATGAVAHVPAIVLRDGDEFRIFFPQEYGHYLAEVVVDTAAGLA
ncbi:MAG: hypothetical protein ABR583_08520 [Gaiellaceae bacterium]